MRADPSQLPYVHAATVAGADANVTVGVVTYQPLEPSGDAGATVADVTSGDA